MNYMTMLNGAKLTCIWSDSGRMQKKHDAISKNKEQLQISID